MKHVYLNQKVWVCISFRILADKVSKLLSLSVSLSKLIFLCVLPFQIVNFKNICGFLELSGLLSVSL